MSTPSPIPHPAPRKRWLERATLTGIAASIAIHLVIMLVASLLSVQFKFGDAGGDQGEGVEFAILTSDQLEAMSTPQIEVDSIETDTTTIESATDYELLAEFGTDLSVSDLADAVAPNLSPGGGALTGIDPSAGSAGAGTGTGASFFGLEAQGTRFAYIVDKSGSMESPTGSGKLTRWELTRNELMRSLSGLDPGAEFTVELYSHSSQSLFGMSEWVRATQPNKVSANAALFGVIPGGATHPNQSLERVLTMKPTPDAIYLMTDGEFVESDRVPARVSALNKGKGVPVHCILFGDPGGNANDTKRVVNTMKSIARSTGGRFTHIRERKP